MTSGVDRHPKEQQLNVEPGYSKKLSDAPKREKIEDTGAGGTVSITQDTLVTGYADKGVLGTPTSATSTTYTNDATNPGLLPPDVLIAQMGQQGIFDYMAQTIDAFAPSEQQPEEETVSFYGAPPEAQAAEEEVQVGNFAPAAPESAPTGETNLSSQDLAFLQSLRASDKETVLKGLKNQFDLSTLSQQDLDVLDALAARIASTNWEGGVEGLSSTDASALSVLLQSLVSPSLPIPANLLTQLTQKLVEANKQFQQDFFFAPKQATLSPEQKALSSALSSQDSSEIFQALKNALKRDPTEDEKTELQTVANNLALKNKEGGFAAMGILLPDAESVLAALKELYPNIPDSLAKELAKQIADTNSITSQNFILEYQGSHLSDEDSYNLQSLSSGDKSKIEEALTSIMGDVPLTDSQKTEISALADKLAAGFPDELNSPNADWLKAELLKLLPPKSEELASTLSTQLATLNQTRLMSLASAPEGPSLTDQQMKLFEGLGGSDPQALVDMLRGILASTAGISDLTALGDLAKALIEKNKGGADPALFSPEMEEVKTFLAGLCSTTLSATALQTISQNIADANLQRLIDLRSTDYDHVYKGLVATENLRLAGSAMSTEDRNILMDGLKWMAKALAFVNLLKGKMSSAEIAQAIKMGRLKEILSDEMTKAALAMCEAQVNEAKTNFDSRTQAIEAEKSRKLWGWLGPLITAVLTVVAIVVTVLTAGTMGPAMLAAIITIQLVLAGLMIADQVLTSEGKTGVMDYVASKILDGMGLDDTDLGKAIVKFILMLAVVLATFGAGAAMTAGAVATTATNMLITTSVSLLFSSGLFTQSFVSIIKACGGDDDQAGLGAMIATIIMMIIVMILSFKYLPPGGGAAAGVGKDVVSSTNTSTLQSIGQNVSKISSTAQYLAAALTVVSQLANSTAQFIKSYQQLKLSQEQEEIAEEMGQIQKLIAELQAALQNTKGTKTLFDDSFTKAMDSALEDWTKGLATIFEQMVQTHSQAAEQAVTG